MTFAEIFLSVLAILALYFFMKPVQKRLEFWIFNFIRNLRPKGRGPIIDVKPTQNNEKQKKSDKKEN